MYSGKGMFGTLLFTVYKQTTFGYAARKIGL